MVRSIPRVMVMEDVEKPRTTYVSNRGSYLQPVSEVSAALPAGSGAGVSDGVVNRLDLALWLASPRTL